MKHIYKNQSALRITMNTKIDLKGITKCEIRYQKPDGATGAFNAGIIDESQGIICHDVVSSSEIDVCGKWVLWAAISFTDGRCATGRSVALYVYEEGRD